MSAASVSEGATLLAGRYRVEPQPFAIGGSATIHRATDERLGPIVAVKRPRTVEAQDRIRHEAIMLVRCAHPGIVTCLDAGEDETGAPYLVLELIDGENLVQRVAGDRVTRAEARTWAREVFAAVRSLHARGIVHGDLKPQHVVIDRAGRAVLVDFDRAHLDGVPAEATGVEVFASPEVRAGAPTTIASDRYAAIAVVRWLLAQTRTGTA